MTEAYDMGRDAFAAWGVDTEAAMDALSGIAISVHCWQGDDVRGVENRSAASGGGIQATANHPGRARTPDELRADLDFAYSLIPGWQRLNLHAFYMDTDEAPDRDAIGFRHFARWVDWARERLWASPDRMMARPQDRAAMLDAMESKLFGIGVEAMTVGSHEFYLGYAASRKVALCLDMGHFHPTESVADKLSSVALSVQDLLLHISRPMRWDSDHVILLGDDILAMAQELVFAGLMPRTRIGLDYFDATISRTAAWVIGARNMQKALLRALLLPQARLKEAEAWRHFTARLMLRDAAKCRPLCGRPVRILRAQGGADGA